MLFLKISEENVYFLKINDMDIIVPPQRQLNEVSVELVRQAEPSVDHPLPKDGQCHVKTLTTLGSNLDFTLISGLFRAISLVSLGLFFLIQRRGM
jgi:hypothetical protein